MHTIEVVVDRLVLREGIERRLTDSLETALRLAEGVAEVEIVARPREGDEDEAENELLTFSQHLACPNDGTSFDELAPRNFSFNSPYGACPKCDGLGTRYEVDPDLVVPNPDLTIDEGAIAPWAGAKGEYFHRVVAAVAEAYGFRVTTPWKKLTPAQQKVLLYGSGTKQLHVQYRNRYGRTRSYNTQYEGAVPYLQRRHAEAESDYMREQIEGYMREVPCATCGGARLKPESLGVTVGELNLNQLCDLSIAKSADYLAALEHALSPRDRMIAERVVREVNARMRFLLDVGLDYLTLNRSAGTLAGGEAQRIRLASQIGSGLVGVLYVLDEPSIGLHQRDNHKLIDTLIRLRDIGNTVIVVEHDEDTIRIADHVVDIGPGAGEHGGEIVVSGSFDDLLAAERSITGQYLAGVRTIPVPAMRREPGDEWLVIRGAREHNLRNIDVEIPLGCLVAVTGVSGSGKSTLVNDILYRALMQRIYRSKTVPGRHHTIEGFEYLDKVINIDQSPIGRTPRSNPATYTGVWDHVRKLFSQTAEARVRGYLPGRFSFNVKGGRCEACAGDGTIKIEMHFLPDVYVPCEVCKGARYNRDTLDVEFKGKNVADVLDMSIEEGAEFFANQPNIARHLRTLADVGLGYVRLGQPAPTLSGGEAQRVKLASELSKRGTGHTIYILDEPTTGLHFEDIRRLLGVLVPAGRPGQHRPGHRAQPRRHQERRLGHRPRPRGRRRRRDGDRRGPARGGGQDRRQLHRPVPGPGARPQVSHRPGADAQAPLNAAGAGGRYVQGAPSGPPAAGPGDGPRRPRPEQGPRHRPRLRLHRLLPFRLVTGLHGPAGGRRLRGGPARPPPDAPVGPARGGRLHDGGRGRDLGPPAARWAPACCPVSWSWARPALLVPYFVLLSVVARDGATRDGQRDRIVAVAGLDEGIHLIDDLKAIPERPAVLACLMSPYDAAGQPGRRPVVDAVAGGRRHRPRARPGRPERRLDRGPGGRAARGRGADPHPLPLLRRVARQGSRCPSWSGCRSCSTSASCTGPATAASGGWSTPPPPWPALSSWSGSSPSCGSATASPTGARSSTASPGWARAARSSRS